MTEPCFDMTKAPVGEDVLILAHWVWRDDYVLGQADETSCSATWRVAEILQNGEAIAVSFNPYCDIGLSPQAWARLPSIPED